jgi:hypothetical protein
VAAVGELLVTHYGRDNDLEIYYLSGYTTLSALSVFMLFSLKISNCW